MLNFGVKIPNEPFLKISSENLERTDSPLDREKSQGIFKKNYRPPAKTAIAWHPAAACGRNPGAAPRLLSPTH